MKTAVKTARLSDLYVTAGDRLYAIGSQDGNFPVLGGHIPGEMGGIWVHPQKVLDGFWLGMAWDRRETAITEAAGFSVAPAYTEHRYHKAGEWSMRRRQWVPDGLPAMVVKLWIFNHLPVERELELTVWIRSNLRPGWLDGAPRGCDQATILQDPPGLLVENNRHPDWQAWVSGPMVDAEWFVTPTDTGPAPRSDGEGLSFGGFRVARRVPADRHIVLEFWIAAATADWQVGQVHALLAAERIERLDKKIRRLQQVQRASRLVVPDRSVEHAYAWAKMQTDWLVRETAGIGRGLGAGLPEYPWWFGCDNGYALRGVLATGGFELAKRTVELLAKVSDQHNGNGRIIHEISGTGVVFNPGNSQESGQFCQLVWEVFRWTGDRDFLQRMAPYAERALQWLLDQAPDGDDLAYGYGIIEVAELDLKVIDTAVYTYVALEAMAHIARVLGNDHRQQELNRRAQRLKGTIRSRFWLSDEGLFGDVIGTQKAMADRLRAWAKSAGQQGRADVAEAFYQRVRSEGGEGTYNLRNWVINTPIEAQIASEEQARQALLRMREADFRGPYGLYLSGLWHTQMMTISTGVQAVAEARYGYADAALDWLQRTARTMDWRMPGSMSEMSPDYGCFVQAWTLYGFAVPIVESFFGLDPRADERRVTICPQMPEAWPWAELTHVKIGDNALDLHYVRGDDDDQILVISTREPWRIDFGDPWAIAEMSHGAIRIASNGVELPKGGEVRVTCMNG